MTGPRAGRVAATAGTLGVTGLAVLGHGTALYCLVALLALALLAAISVVLPAVWSSKSDRSTAARRLLALLLDRRLPEDDDP